MEHETKQRRGEGWVQYGDIIFLSIYNKEKAREALLGEVLAPANHSTTDPSKQPIFQVGFQVISKETDSKSKTTPFP